MRMRAFIVAMCFVWAAQAQKVPATANSTAPAFDALEKCFIQYALAVDDGRSDPIAVARAMLSLCHVERRKLIDKLLGASSSEVRIAEGLVSRRDTDIDQAASFVLLSRRRGAEAPKN